MTFFQLCGVAFGWALMAAIFAAGLGIIAIVAGLALGHGLEDRRRILRRVVAAFGVVAVGYAAWLFPHNSVIGVPLGLGAVALLVAASMDRIW